MITKLVSYHATPTYHVGHETENICVAYHCMNLTIDHSTYQDYIHLCNKYGVAPYNESVFNEHLDKIPYRPWHTELKDWLGSQQIWACQSVRLNKLLLIMRSLSTKRLASIILHISFLILNQEGQLITSLNPNLLLKRTKNG